MREIQFQYKMLAKNIGWLVTLGATLIGVVFGAGKIMEEFTMNQEMLQSHTAILQSQQSDLEKVRRDQAVAVTERMALEKRLDNIETNTLETNKMLHELVKQKLKERE